MSERHMAVKTVEFTLKILNYEIKPKKGNYKVNQRLQFEFTPVVFQRCNLEMRVCT